MECISLFIPVRPEPKGRPRFGVRRAASGKAFVSVHTPDATRTAEAAIAAYVRSFLNRSDDWKGLWQGPLKLRATFAVERPRSVTERIWPVNRPDLDNYGKLLCDALNSLVWVDDSQVVQLNIAKSYADEQNPVGIYLEITQLMSAEENGQKKCTLNKGRKRNGTSKIIGRR